MSNSETHTVSMPSEFWEMIDRLAIDNHTTRSNLIQDSVKKCYLNDDRDKRLRLFNVVSMLLLFVIILLLLVVIL